MIRNRYSIGCALILLAVLAGVNFGKEAAQGKLAALSLQASSDPKAEARLVGRDARRQVLVTGRLEGGAERDFTRAASYSVQPAGIVQISKSGLVEPLADGKAVITASADGHSSSLSITVERFNESLPVHFANEVVPIFTKTGCNGGGCHGKSSGQNGFRLSLLGFEPTEDYEHLVKESRGRRISVAAPAQSLLLLKAAAILPHGGGKRIDIGSADYKLLVRWISQGMPYGDPAAPTVARIEVLPRERMMTRDGEQQLLVLAHYTDGSVRDATHDAMYEANDKELGQIESDGKLKVYRQSGDVSVMVRYQGQVGVFTASIPLGAPVAKLPPARNFIDELVFKKLKSVGMPPSDICDDATFIRRVTLDIAGRLPTAEESQSFLADKDPAKRDRLIDTLLESTDYADFFAGKWSALLRNKRSQPTHMRGNFAFHAWIRDSLNQNKPYDQFVREVVAASGDMAYNPPVAWYRQVNTTNTQLEDTAQLFLGTRLQCAQCHHHPFERWSQQDYYSFSAFFSQVGRKAGSDAGEEVIYHKRGTATATNKKTKQPVKPAGLGSTPLDIAPENDPRQALADWMTTPSNRFFAPALANRYWKHFFSRALVEPEDDMRETNPPTNPELLAALAQHFVASKYDMKDLIRTICRSTTYQLSAIPNEHNATDKMYYSRYYPKRLMAEVLLDSINNVAGSMGDFPGLPVDTRAVQLPDNSFNANSYFLTVFGRPDSSSACECERSMDASLAQSLHLFNSRELQTKIASDTGRAARLASAEDKRDDDQKITELYLMVFARKPEAEELALAKAHLAKPALNKEGKPQPPNRRQAYEDIIWALLNTKEFLFNH